MRIAKQAVEPSARMSSTMVLATGGIWDIECVARRPEIFMIMAHIAETIA